MSEDENLEVENNEVEVAPMDSIMPVMPGPVADAPKEATPEKGPEEVIKAVITKSKKKVVPRKKSCF